MNVFLKLIRYIDEGGGGRGRGGRGGEGRGDKGCCCLAVLPV